MSLPNCGGPRIRTEVSKKVTGIRESEKEREAGGEKRRRGGEVKGGERRGETEMSFQL